MPIVSCHRCERKVAKGVLCSYCGKFVGFECLKAQKRIKDRRVLHLYICKSCWNVMDYRKKYKRNEPNIYPAFDL